MRKTTGMKIIAMCFISKMKQEMKQTKVYHR